MADEETPDAGRDFAALMSGAAAAAAPETDAPFGYTIDRATGEHRPKKAAGRPKAPPSLDELKAAREASEPPAPAEDRAPSGRRKHRARSQGAAVAAAPAGETVPQHRPGLITKGVNRLYRRAGKIVKAMDRDIGIAIIESTKNTAEDGEPDDSVGAAWDEVARTNPRIRVFLLRLVAGGAWGQLLMAHGPIFLAVVMKDGIRSRIPFMKLIETMAEPDDDAPGPDDGAAPEGIGGLLKGMTPDDMRQMAELGQSLMGQTAARAPAGRARAPGAASGKTAA